MAGTALRVGVVGVGFGATVHIPGFQSEGVEVVAICTRRRERAEEAATRFGVAQVFTDYDELLSSDAIDAVSIVTPVPLHHEMSMAALAAGKHVICEKPFTTDAKLARQLWEKARDTGLTAMIAHEFRFASGRMRVKELIDEGYIGQMQVTLMRLVMGAGRPPAVTPPAFSADRDLASRGAGFLFGLGSHYIDCLRHWFGEVVSVTGDAKTLSPAERIDGERTVLADADDTFQFTLEFAGGGMAHMIASRVTPFAPGPAVEIYGNKGTLVTPQRGVNPPSQGTILGAQIGDEKLTPLEIPDRLQPFADERDDRLMPFRMFVREFVRGVEEGASPAPNFYDGMRCQEILDAVRESSATGRRVAIAPSR